jgi:hypothetical protein
MPLLATDMLVHFDLKPFGSPTVFAFLFAALCWVSVESGLPSPNPKRRTMSALLPSALLALYLISWATGSLAGVLPRAHVGGWSRIFSAKECLALYILLAVAAAASARVLRTRGTFFRVAGSVQLALSIAFMVREFSIIWQWHSFANQVTSADGGWRVLSASMAQWPATAEFLRWAL